MYHLQLRQFPHNLCRFNLSEQELAVIVQPWAHEQWVELGERKWSPHQAKLTVLEGPSLPLAQLSMGRGWRNAERNGEDVTDSLLAAARQASQAAVQQPAPQAGVQQPASQAVAQASGSRSSLADSLGLELLAALGPGPLPLLRVWELAASRDPGRPVSESLALAELTVSSLLNSKLIVLATGDPPVDVEPGDAASRELLAAIAGWVGEPPAERVWIRRS